MSLFLQKLSTLTIAKFTICTRTDFTLQTSVKYLRAITMFGAFIPGCGYDNGTIILIGDVYCPNTKFSGKLFLQKGLFNLFQGAIINVCVRGAQYSFIFEDQTNSFSLSYGHGVYIFEESPKSIEDVIGDVYCPGYYCSSREKCESLGGYVTTPR